MSKIENNYNSIKLILLYSILIFFGRLVPHIPNFTPIFAVIIFSSYFKINLNNKIIFVLIPLILSDLFLGFYKINFWVYSTYILLILINDKFLNKNLKYVILKALSYNFIFYIITNFAVWFGSSFYTKDLNGLLECYILAIPFFGNAIISTLIFLFIFVKLEKFSIYKNLKKI